MVFKSKELMIVLQQQEAVKCAQTCIGASCLNAALSAIQLCRFNQPTLCRCASHPITCLCATHPITCFCLTRGPSCYCVTMQVSCQCLSIPHTQYYASPDCGTPDPGPLDYGQLREQLQQTLKAVEQQEKAADELLQPQTLEEAELLEAKMKDALAEIGRIKENLRKR